MQNLQTTWNALDLRRRAVVIAATLAVFLSVLALARIAAQPRMALLYAGLDGAAAGQVIAALEQQGAVFAIEGDSIRVEASRRDELRMVLAGEGLPAAGAAGYELLDGLSGFGTTSQMFDAAYWRAKEGELARTIMAMPGVRAARVHLARAPAQPFVTEDRPTASVTVTTFSTALTAAQARAIRHLVSAAVAGLSARDVSVIDAANGLVAAEEDAAVPGNAEAREADLKRNVERLLSARLGPGRAVVEVSLDIDTEREQLTERRFDPQTRVAISSETEERSESTTQPGGDVTVASNLPEGDAAAGADGRSQTSETRERVNYEVSESSRQIDRAPGGIRRLSVAVLIDGDVATAPDGTVTPQPRGEEEIAALRDLVASAVGFNAERGDVLTVKSMPFEPSTAGASLPEAGAMTGMMTGMTTADVIALIQLAVLALVVLVLAVFVLRPLLAPGAARAALPAGTVPLALPAAPEAAGADGLRVLTGEIEDGAFAQDRSREPAAAMASHDPDPDPVARLRRLIAERQTESVEILRGWMEAEEERV